jgi:hypothetical protein
MVTVLGNSQGNKRRAPGATGHGASHSAFDTVPSPSVSILAAADYATTPTMRPLQKHIVPLSVEMISDDPCGTVKNLFPPLAPIVSAYLTVGADLICAILLGLGFMMRYAWLPLLIFAAITQFRFEAFDTQLCWIESGSNVA